MTDKRHFGPPVELSRWQNLARLPVFANACAENETKTAFIRQSRTVRCSTICGKLKATSSDRLCLMCRLHRGDVGYFKHGTFVTFDTKWAPELAELRRIAIQTVTEMRDRIARSSASCRVCLTSVSAGAHRCPA
jgi:hypothetical protein